MRNTKKMKRFLEASIILSITIAFILPASAITTEITEKNNYFDKILSSDRVQKIAIRDIKRCGTTNNIGTLSNGEDIQITGWYPGDDILPSITKDMDGNIVITWTNEEDITTSNIGITYSDNPTDPNTWFDNGVVMALQGPQHLIYADTAYIAGPEPDDYKGLYGVFLAADTEEAGFYLIPDVTDDNTWEFYTWQGGAPEPEYACVSDNSWYHVSIPSIQYDGYGPYNMYIYHEIYPPYDIPSCPVCFHNDVAGGTGGVGFFDAQSNEQTAPASDPDMANFEDRFHTVVQYTDPSSNPHIVWKKIKPDVEPDYEYTPWQDTIADGSNPSIAAYLDGNESHVAIVYMAADGSVECVYSSDDGDTWSTSTVASSGSYPDIYADDTTLLCAYIDAGNLYLVNSTDGGATWSEPVQINDEDGTVAMEENSVDIHRAGIVWVDNRNTDKDIYFEPFAQAPSAHIEIGDITGGLFFVKAEIKNTGNAEATDVEVSIVLDGGFILFGKETHDTISAIPAGGSVDIRSSLILGLGLKTTVTVSANGADKSVQAIILGPLVIIK